MLLNVVVLVCSFVRLIVWLCVCLLVLFDCLLCDVVVGRRLVLVDGCCLSVCVCLFVGVCWLIDVGCCLLFVVCLLLAGVCCLLMAGVCSCWFDDC